MISIIFDRSSYAISKREYTDEGFLKVPGRVARTGVQLYTAGELGLDGEPTRIVKIGRMPEDVFDSESLDSYTGADVTVEHPTDFINSESYKANTAGTVIGNARKDGDYVVVDMIIKDKQAIQAVESGKVQLSAGYTATYEKCDNGDCEYVQRNIRINHVALVDRARAGAQARLFDKQLEQRTVKITLDSKRSVEIADEATAALVTDTIERLTDAADEAKAEAEKCLAAKDAMAEELEKFKAEASDEAISKRVAEVTKAISDAKSLVGDEFTCDSISVEKIQAEAMKCLRPNFDWADRSAVYINAAFDMAMESKKEEMEDEEEEEAKKKKAEDSHKKLAEDAASAPTEFTDGIQAACSAYADFLTNPNGKEV